MQTQNQLVEFALLLFVAFILHVVLNVMIKRDIGKAIDQTAKTWFNILGWGVEQIGNLIVGVGQGLKPKKKKKKKR